MRQRFSYSNLASLFSSIYRVIPLLGITGCVVMLAEIGAHADSSRIHELGGRVFIDAKTESSGVLQADKFFEMLGVSTPTATPANNHAQLWLNDGAKQVCSKFDDGSTTCFGSGGGSGGGTITGVTAGNGLLGGGTTGTVSLAVNYSSVTAQGNVFNGTSQLVQTNSSGQLPSLSGINLTALNPANISAGSLSAGVQLSYQVSVSTGLTIGALNSGIRLGYAVSVTTGIIGVLPVLNGGTGVTTPSLVAGTNITSITGTWPNQTINATTQSGSADMVLASTQVVTGAKQFNSYTNLFGTSTIKGTTTNDNALAGNIGEYVESVVALTNFPGTSNYGDLTSISLTAGDWDVTGIIFLANNGSVTSTYHFGISTTSGNSATGLVEGSNSYDFVLGVTAAGNVTSAIPSYRQSFSTTTTVYLKYRASYTGGPPQAAGRLSARRMR